MHELESHEGDTGEGRGSRKRNVTGKCRVPRSTTRGTPRKTAKFPQMAERAQVVTYGQEAKSNYVPVAPSDQNMSPAPITFEKQHEASDEFQLCTNIIRPMCCLCCLPCRQVDWVTICSQPVCSLYLLHVLLWG